MIKINKNVSYYCVSFVIRVNIYCSNSLFDTSIVTTTQTKHILKITNIYILGIAGL